ncbi:MAG: universal stress protein [Chitinophagaceae bacterium]|jgi:nucleotide-binding universal stress UspA family protein|nr:universal stress protein [Chitinophagaceae bacterium]
MNFERILVPADLTINTEVAVRKAAALAIPGLTTVHVVHISEYGAIGAGLLHFVPFRKSTGNEWVHKKMEAVKIKVESEFPGVSVYLHHVSSIDIQKEIMSFALSLKADLIVLGKNNYHSLLPFRNTVHADAIIAATGCPVLTVKPGAKHNQPGIVVMPVQDYFPRKKLELLAMVSGKANLNVHLLTILDNGRQIDNHSASALLQSLRSIRYKLQCNVQHCTLHSSNKAMAILRYAKRVDADMLLVSPETETTIHTWINKKNITDAVKPASQLQVLSVQSNQ